MSGASTWKPASPSGPIWCRHEYAISGKPCSSSTSGPSGGPDSRQNSRTPLVTTNRPRTESTLTGTVAACRDVRRRTTANEEGNDASAHAHTDGLDRWRGDGVPRCADRGRLFEQREDCGDDGEDRRRRV